MKTNSAVRAQEAKVPVALFCVTVLAQLALAGAAFRWMAPAAWAEELARPGLLVLGVFLIALPLSLFEYLYHRYLLHSAVLPFLGRMHRAHSIHHSLTYVKAPVRADDPGKMVPVESQYPILVEEQEESMMFPLYSLSIFYAIFLAALALPLKLALPGFPVVSALILAVTWQYTAYEMWHAVLHQPFERFWAPLLSNRFTGACARRVYSFHLMHHWRPSSNLAVVGFFGVAVWDHLFRTHRRPEHLPIQGGQVNFADQKLHTPLFPISVLDRWQGAWNRRSRKVETFVKRLFVRRESQPS